jgi:RNA polymerase sigma-70 factor (TIGR02957 family)
VSAPQSQWLEDLRPPTFAIAYRMLGSVAEAEDIVQETLLRVHRALVDEQPIESLRAYAATIATRLAIDQLRSARVRRETYVGEWLPEPIVSDPASDPARQAEMADSLSLAFLVLLESLSPEQRAALLLRDVFDYGYEEIAEIVGTSTVNARQLATRARRHVDTRRPRFAAARAEREELAERFFAAARDGDLKALEALLAQDVVLHGDGGGKVPALARALHGRARVARTLVTWARLGFAKGGASLRPVDVNGQPGALLLDSDGGLIGVMALDVADGQIQGVRSIVNPEKIGHVGRVGEMRTMLGRGRA